MRLESVIYVICPGSGGYDAIFVIALQEIAKELKARIADHKLREISI
jgi:phosphomevalonate kinase